MSPLTIIRDPGAATCSNGHVWRTTRARRERGKRDQTEQIEAATCPECGGRAVRFTPRKGLPAEVAGNDTNNEMGQEPRKETEMATKKKTTRKKAAPAKAGSTKKTLVSVLTAIFSRAKIGTDEQIISEVKKQLGECFLTSQPSRLGWFKNAWISKHDFFRGEATGKLNQPDPGEGRAPRPIGTRTEKPAARKKAAPKKAARKKAKAKAARKKSTSKKAAPKRAPRETAAASGGAKF